jgi:hypothetical protein
MSVKQHNQFSLPCKRICKFQQQQSPKNTIMANKVKIQEITRPVPIIMCINRFLGAPLNAILFFDDDGTSTA